MRRIFHKGYQKIPQARRTQLAPRTPRDPREAREAYSTGYRVRPKVSAGVGVRLCVGEPL